MFYQTNKGFPGFLTKRDGSVTKRFYNNSGLKPVLQKSFIKNSIKHRTIKVVGTSKPQQLKVQVKQENTQSVPKIDLNVGISKITIDLRFYQVVHRYQKVNKLPNP